MLAAYEITSGWGAAVSIIVLGAIAVCWLICLFMVIADRLGIGAKIVWIVVLTMFAPVAIPIYLITRHRRLASA